MSVQSPERTSAGGVEGEQPKPVIAPEKAAELKDIAAETNRRTEAWSSYRSQTDPSSGFADAEAARIQDAKENSGKPRAERHTTDQGHEVTVLGTVNSSVGENGEVSITGGHPTDLNAPVVAAVRESLAHAVERSAPGRKVTVIYEGNWAPGADVSEEGAIARGHESALLAKLAQEGGLDIVSGEPSSTEIQRGLAERGKELEQLGISQQEIYAQGVLSGIEGVVRAEGDVADFLYRRAAEVGIDGYSEPTPAERAKIKDDGEVATQTYLQQRREAGVKLVPQLNAVILAETGKADTFIVGEDGSITLNPILMALPPGDRSAAISGMYEGDNKLRRVREIKSEIRDQVIFQRVADASLEGDVLVVYGGSHISSLQPVFESYFEARPS